MILRWYDPNQLDILLTVSLATLSLYYRLRYDSGVEIITVELRSVSDGPT